MYLQIPLNALFNAVLGLLLAYAVYRVSWFGLSLQKSRNLVGLNNRNYFSPVFGDWTPMQECGPFMWWRRPLAWHGDRFPPCGYILFPLLAGGWREEVWDVLSIVSENEYNPPE